MQIFFYLIIVFILELVAVLLLVSKETLFDVFNEDRIQISKWFGNEKSLQMAFDAKQRFEDLFVDTGISDFIYELFYTDQQVDLMNAGMNDVRDSAFISMTNERIEFVWVILESAMLRIEMILICMLISLCFIIPMVIDGLSKWQISRSGDANSSINIYGVAEKVFYSSLLFPIYIVFLPFAVSPLLMFSWTFVLGVSAWFLTSNLQHRI